MNNTTKTRTLAIAAILAVTLVVGGMLTTATAFAYKKVAHDKGKHNAKGNGNTDTNQNCNNNAYASGLDPEVNQDCEPLICTHPNNNATCSQEGVTSAITAAGNNTVPVTRTCEQCFTTILTPQQITAVLGSDGTALCILFRDLGLDESDFRVQLSNAGVDVTTQNELIACLKDAGIRFVP